MTNNTGWIEVCEAYCNKIGAELLFVNDFDFGYAKGEHLVHLYADDLVDILSGKEVEFEYEDYD